MNRTLVADDVQTLREEREFEFGRVTQGALIAAGTAACLNLLVYVVARAAGVTFTGRFNPAVPETVVALKDVLGASIVWVVPASAGLLLLNRFMERPSKVSERSSRPPRCTSSSRRRSSERSSSGDAHRAACRDDVRCW